MKIYFIKEDALTTLKNNIEINLTKYAKETNEWIVEYLGENPFLEYNKEVEEIKFDTSSEQLSELDWKNAIILHKALKNVSRNEASDERFWSGLAHTTCWEFVQQRQNLKKRKFKAENIRNNYFFGSSEKRSLYINTLSRLWWVAESVYDKENENPYWLMKFFENDFSTKALIIFSSNFTSNTNIIKGMISAFLKLQENGIPINREKYYKTCTYLNIIGGNTILDYYSEEDIYRIVYNMYESSIEK